MFRSVDFRIIAKHPQEWPEYIANVSKIYGFKQRLNPTCFRKQGIYIGGYDEMVRELSMRFGTDDVALEGEDVVDPEVACA